MPPRPYDSTLRLQKQAELKARIAAAAVALHAEKGAIATSYADIARMAGVSLPTVHAHFPTQDDLLAGCTGHVAARAPAFPADAVLAACDLATAFDALAAAVDQQHRYFEPWLAWRQERTVPFVAMLSARTREHRSDFVAQLLRKHLGAGDHREAVATCESVLSFDFWYRLVREHGLSRPAAHRAIVRCLAAATGDGATAARPSPPRTRR